MSCPEDIQMMLAGYVDDELSDVERRAVEEHLVGCAECRALLNEQREAAAVYAGYTVEPAEETQWQGVWQQVERRLPAPGKRVALEKLADLEAAEEAPAEEAAAPSPLPEAPAPITAKEAEEEKEVEKEEPEPEAPPAKEREKERKRPRPGRLPEPRREREPVFRPLRIVRLRHTIWAHVAGVAASILIAAMVILSVKPVIRIEQLATTGQVEIGYDMAIDPDQAPVIIMLRSEGGANIPLIWVAHVEEETEGQEETVQ